MIGYFIDILLGSQHKEMDKIKKTSLGSETLQKMWLVSKICFNVFN